MSQHRVAKSYPTHPILCSAKSPMFTNYEAFVSQQLGSKTTFANAGGLHLQKHFATEVYKFLHYSFHVQYLWVTDNAARRAFALHRWHPEHLQHFPFAFQIAPVV